MDTLLRSRYSPLRERKVSSLETHWRPGFRYFPWIGGISIVVGLCCVVACVAVITLSDDEPVYSWKYQPAVWLAVISSIANISIAAAFSQGAAIAWWRSALRGTDLKTLHYIWSFGTGTFRLTRKWNTDTFKLALVALVVIVSTVISNPLLQRATHSRNGNMIGDVNMTIDMMDDPLDQVYGMAETGVPANTLLYASLIESVQQWYSKTPISTLALPGYYCNGTCEGVVTSPGIDVNCSSTKTLLNLRDPGNEGALLFSINVGRFQNSLNGETLLGLHVLYSAEVDDNCVATIVSERCNISTAMVQRPIRIENRVISINREAPSELISRFYSDLDSIYTVDGDNTGPLSVLDWLGEFYFLSNFTLDLDLLPYGMGERAYGIVPTAVAYGNYENISSACYFTWRNPTLDILEAMEEVLFRMAHRPGNIFYPMTNQTFLAQQITPALVFRSNYHYLGGAITIMTLALLVVLVPLWGWWELGRPVSLSPVETAKAFGAPMLRHATGAVNAGGLVDEVGDLRIRYGKVMLLDDRSGAPVSMLEMGHQHTVRRPSKGESFGTSSRSGTSHSFRGQDYVLERMSSAR